MNLIPLTPTSLAISASLVLLLAVLVNAQRLGIAKTLLIAATRAFIQLLLLGYILHIIFELKSVFWVLTIALVMMLIAGREVMARQKRQLTGWWSFGTGTFSLFVSSFCVLLIALTTIVNVQPWYHPQYLIPLLGMLLGNTMNGIAVSLDRLLDDVWQHRRTIETQLALGFTSSQSMQTFKQKALRAGLIPLINSMAVAGIVSLPGMMTGQLLSGSPPLEAAKYQIMIFFLIAAGTGFGAWGAVVLASNRLFDERQRLRLERLKSPD